MRALQAEGQTHLSCRDLRVTVAAGVPGPSGSHPWVFYIS